MPKEYKVVITDSSCFIILQKINAIHLLNDLFAVVITTREIAGEYGFSLPDWDVIQSVLRKLFKIYWTLPANKFLAFVINQINHLTTINLSPTPASSTNPFAYHRPIKTHGC